MTGAYQNPGLSCQETQQSHRQCKSSALPPSNEITYKGYGGLLLLLHNNAAAEHTKWNKGSWISGIGL